MITPSALNVLIIGLSVIIFNLLARLLAARLADRDSAFGEALAAVV